MLTFGKQNHSHGHVEVSCINFHSFFQLYVRMESRDRSVLVTGYTSYQGIQLHFMWVPCQIIINLKSEWRKVMRIKAFYLSRLIWCQNLVCEVTSWNSDRVLKEWEAFFITFVSRHSFVILSSRVISKLIVHNVVWNVLNPGTVFHAFGEPALGGKYQEKSLE